VKKDGKTYRGNAVALAAMVANSPQSTAMKSNA
jgi:hypothetical protein